MTTTQTRLEKAVAVIEAAMEMALGFFETRATIATGSKGFQDFVTEADTSVERLVRERLAEAFPGEAVVGEEMGGVGGDAYWIIDPIDGTANFLRGSPLWGISLGTSPMAGPISASSPCRCSARSMPRPTAPG